MRRFLSGAALGLLAAISAASGATVSSTVDRAGRALPPRVAAQLAALGVTGRTTLDAAVQRTADAALDDGLTEARAQGLFPTGGAAVVLGVDERAILALASAPEPASSRALVAVPAGSVAKPFVAAGAIGAGLDPSRPRPCPARFTAGGATIRNWRDEDRPSLTIAEAIAESCNTVFASLADELWRAGERSSIGTALVRFGFGAPTGFVPGESPGRLPPSPATLGDLMILSIGQGPFAVTPLQVATGFAVLAGARGGWVSLTGSAVPPPAAPPAAALLGPVREGLVRAVRDGTAREAFEDVALDRMPIAGKTGSAEVGDAAPYGWFAAYAPAGRPRYVVAVVVERGRAGAISAAPIARRILDGILDLPRTTPAPIPHPAAALLVLPLLAGLASPAAGPLAGLGAGAAAGALAGGSLAAGALAFAVAGWISGSALGRRAAPFGLAAAAAVGTLGLPSSGRPVWWIASRAAVAGAAALVAGLARRTRAG